MTTLTASLPAIHLGLPHPRLPRSHDALVARIARSDRYSARVVTTARGKRVARAPRHYGVRQWGVRAVSAVCVALMAGIAVIGMAQPASANWFSDALEKVFCSDSTFFAAPQAAGGGIAGLMGPNGGVLAAVQNASATAFGGDKEWLATPHTAYEKFGMQGTTWTVFVGGVDPKSISSVSSRPQVTDPATDPRTNRASCMPILQVSATYLANSTFGVTKGLTQISTWMMSMAYSPSWIDGINSKIAEVITGPGGQGGLKDALYFPFLDLVILLGALYLGWTGIVKKQSMEAASSFGWMLGCVLIGSLLMFNPSLVPSMANSVVNGVSEAMLTATAGTAGGKPDPLCALDAPSGETPAAASSRITREVTCEIWETFVYIPWAVGQFGAVPSVVDAQVYGSDSKAPSVSLGGQDAAGHPREVTGLAVSQVDAQTLSADEIAQGTAQAALANQTRWNSAMDDVLMKPSAAGVAANWTGMSTGADRVQVATASVVGSGAGLAIIAVLSVNMLAYTLGTSILTFFSVIFLLLGAHPGFGRRLALRWAEMYVGTILKRIITAAMLSMVLTFFSVILQSATTDWLASVMAIIAVSVAVLIYRKTIMGAVGEVNFGGSGFDSQPLQAAGQKVKGVIGGAVLGGVGSLAGAAGVASAGAAGGLSKVQSVAKAAGVVGKGAARGAARGASGRGGSGMYAAMGAHRTAQGEAHSMQAENARRDAEARRAAEKAQREEQEANSPQAYAKEQQRRETAARQYVTDYGRYGQSEEWVSRFQRTYGQQPLDPRMYRFEGYGRTQADLRNDPTLRPQPIRTEQPQPQQRREQEQPMPKPNANAPKGGSGQQRPRRPEQPMPKPKKG